MVSGAPFRFCPDSAISVGFLCLFPFLIDGIDEDADWEGEWVTGLVEEDKDCVGDLDMAYTPLIGVGSSSSSSTSAAVSSCVLKIRLGHCETRKC